VHVVGVPTANGRLRRMTSTPWHVLARAVTSGAKVCHFHDPELIPIGFVLKLPGRRVIYEVHDDFPRDILTKSWVHPTIRVPLAAAVTLVEAVTGQVFDGIVTATPTIAARFPTAKTITWPISPCSMSSARLSRRRSTRTLRVCYVGHLSKVRGLFDMIFLLLAGDFGSAGRGGVHLAGRQGEARRLYRRLTPGSE
jgi:hypothetical protein